MKSIILIATATTTGLMAGLFFAWSFSVTPGLARLANEEYIRAMQAMNRAILNPVFYTCFFCAVILLPVCTYFNYSTQPGSRFWFLLIATTIYLVGVFGVTVFGNIPLNESLDAFNMEIASSSEIADKRDAFEGPWNKLNNIRTAASILAFIAVVLACISPKSF